MTVFGLQPRFGWPNTIMFALLYTSVIAGMFLRFEPAPIDHYNYWREVSETHVRPGEKVMISTKLHIFKTSCNADLTRRWYDTAGNLVRQDQFKIAKFESEYIEHQLAAVIPGGAADGVLRMSATVQFRCNPIQQMFGGTDFIFPDLYFLTQG